MINTSESGLLQKYIYRPQFICSHSNLETEILITLVLQSFNSKLHISLNKFLKMKLFLTTSVLDVHQSLQCHL